MNAVIPFAFRTSAFWRQIDLAGLVFSCIYRPLDRRGSQKVAHASIAMIPSALIEITFSPQVQDRCQKIAMSIIHSSTCRSGVCIATTRPSRSSPRMSIQASQVLS